MSQPEWGDAAQEAYRLMAAEEADPARVAARRERLLRFREKVDESMATLDGSTESAVALVIGFSPERLAELGGVPEDT